MEGHRDGAATRLQGDDSRSHGHRYTWHWLQHYHRNLERRFAPSVYATKQQDNDYTLRKAAAMGNVIARSWERSHN